MNAIPILEHRRIHCSAASGFGLIELTNASPLRVQLLPSGAVFAIRHGATLINQLMPGPVDDGLFRLLLRWRGERAREPRHESPPEGWARLVGAGLVFEANASGAVWRCIPLPGLQCETRLQLHATLPAWSWQIKLHNASLAPFALDVLHAQDLGLADETAVRNNEAYVSQYIDLYPVRDHELGWTLLARQNQQMAGQQHPWLGVACTGGAAEYCTDGWQFFGPDHRLTGVPAAVRRTRLPSHVFQYEAALAGLQSQLIALKPGADAEVTFIARFVDDHPAASSAEDVELIRALAKETAVLPSPAPIADRLGESDDHAIAMDPPRRPSASLFIQAPWLHGDPPTIGDWDAWFHGPRRHEEFGQDDSLLSFFHGPNTHVVAREKEAVVFRPHGHILRSGDSHWFDHEHFGVTCYAAGIFGAQAYLGHPSFARLLSVIRNALNATRSSGQRVFVRREGQWQQLGIPSAFVIKPGEVRWLYRFGDDVIGARVWCARKIAASFLALSVTAGPACEFLITHELALGALEFEHPGTLAFQSEASWVSCEPSRDSLVGQHQPNVAFAIASAEAGATFTVAGDGLVYPDGMDRHGPYVTVRTRSVEGCGVIMLGTSQGVSALAEQVAVARQAFASHIATTSGSSAFDSVRTTMDSLAA
ncbi:MAG TPA: hypothetical protein VL069_10350, partial [Opitutus sp.]|nr:hypothetical protein [Opitutus sp.]